MTKRTRFTRLSQRVSAARVAPLQAFTGIIIVLVLGVGIGANTNVWNDGLRVLGLKRSVPPLDLSSLQQTYQALATNYDGTLDTGKLIDGANHGLVSAAGNAYTVYFDKDEVSAFNDDLDGSYSGIGVELGLKDSVPSVISVIDGSPAQKAGVQAGDRIVAIGGQSTDGWSVDKTARAILGKSGSTVKVTLARGDTPVDLTITRATITNPSVKSRIDGSIGIMTINRFGLDANGRNTGDLARTAAADFKKAGVTGVILDLRGNGGGYVDGAQAVASLWLSNKTIVTERAGGTVTNTLHSLGNPVLSGIPTVVLIDGGSASASEIVAGALHDNGAATLIGQKSFGKGSVQNVLDLPGGNELKVTAARWYTPSGRNIDGQGITPDTVITPTADQIQAGDDTVLTAALAKLGR